MLRKIIITLIVLAVLGAVAGWIITTPRTLAATDLPDHTPDLANGETMFWASGCESCHAKPDATGDELFILGGGEPLVTPFGTFHAPNISPDKEDGIGDWSVLDFVNAMKMGVGKNGSHLYPAFPYTSYQRMRIEDLIDLKAFMDTLPAVEGKAPPHELPFPFNIRRGLGTWKLLYVNGETYEPDPALDEATNRGGYLVEGPGHCKECHSPRNPFGGLIASQHLAGGPPPEGTGDDVPNITPHQEALGWWSEEDIVAMFETGLTPNFDTVDGSMGPVQRNMAMLDRADWEAMAKYMKTIPAIAPTQPASE